MLAWAKANSSLVFGIILPVLVALGFVLAAVLPTAVVEPPRHDFLYASGYYTSDYQFKVIDGALQIEAAGGRTSRNARLYRYDSARDASIEIPLPSPPLTKTDTWRKVVSPDTQHLVLLPSNVSPDGYRVDSRREARGHLLGLMFDGYSHRGLRLSKNGRSIPVIPPSGEAYSPMHFIGWIIGEKK